MKTATQATASDSFQADELPLSARADPTQLQPAEHVRRTWWHVPSATRAIDDLLDPAYWSRCTQKFSAGGADQAPDRIECMPADRRWFLELMVLEVAGDGVLVMRVAGGELPRYRLPPKRKPLGLNPDEYHFKDMGAISKWAVVRTSDSHVMIQGLTREQCAQWLHQYLQTVGAT
jgi:hypothetical protein